MEINRHVSLTGPTTRSTVAPADLGHRGRESAAGDHVDVFRIFRFAVLGNLEEPNVPCLPVDVAFVISVAHVIRHAHFRPFAVKFWNGYV